MAQTTCAVCGGSGQSSKGDHCGACNGSGRVADSLGCR